MSTRAAPLVVYIDDEKPLCRAFELLFRRSDVTVRTFTDPQAALAFVRDNDVCVVFCDYRMPRMSGLEVIERIEKDVPFYVLTGDLGVAEWTNVNPRLKGTLGKPFRAEDVLAIARTHCSSP